MKKILILALALVLCFSLVACGNNNEETPKVMADGVYTAVADDAYVNSDGRGWRDTLVVTYEDGKMVSAKYDAINVDTGQRKSELTAEEYPMPTPVSTWIPELNANILRAGTAADIDIVAGATSSSNMVKWLLWAIETDGEPGKSITVTIS